MKYRGTVLMKGEGGMKESISSTYCNVLTQSIKKFDTSEGLWYHPDGG
jgi:hypothetical protein